MKKNKNSKTNYNNNKVNCNKNDSSMNKTNKNANKDDSTRSFEIDPNDAHSFDLR